MMVKTKLHPPPKPRRMYRTFNGNNIDSDMYTVASYIGGLINDTFSVDFSAGYKHDWD